MASFTSAGDNVELAVPARGETVSIAISGTYDMTILFQKENGSPGSGSWATIDTFSTANATVAQDYVTSADNEVLRLYVSVDDGGTATATLTDSVLTFPAVKDPVGNTLVEYHQGGVRFPGSLTVGPPVVLTGDLTLTADTHAGRTIVFNTAAGDTVTLPAATGTGDVYKFFVAVTVTSNNDIVQVANASDTMAGHVLIEEAGAATVASHWRATGTEDTMTLNGTTKGGIVGDYFEFEDVASGLWRVSGFMTTTGTEVTPFSAAVS